MKTLKKKYKIIWDKNGEIIDISEGGTTYISDDVSYLESDTKSKIEDKMKELDPNWNSKKQRRKQKEVEDKIKGKRERK